MTGQVLIVADPRDRLSRAVASRLPQARLLDARAGFPASFRLAATGALEDGRFEFDARSAAWRSGAAVLVRPGTSWDLPSRFGSTAEGIACHERRAAWCALLRAFPGRVVDRLAPAWFVDRQLYGLALAHGLARRLAADVVDAAWPLDPAATSQGVYAVGGRVVAPGAAPSSSLVVWLRRRHRSLQAWHRDTGLDFVRIVGRRSGRGWSMARVDPAPTVSGLDAVTLQTLAGALVEELR